MVKEVERLKLGSLGWLGYKEITNQGHLNQICCFSLVFIGSVVYNPCHTLSFDMLRMIPRHLLDLRVLRCEAEELRIIQS